VSLSHPVKSVGTVTIKELHARTGSYVRRAAKTPLHVTDRGRLVAVLAAPHLVAQPRRKRALLPEYEALMALPPGNDIQAALDEIRGER
jgi:antitoxin (DNA-binding transcriptional repressor) of toxin-antitoxin stability system